MFFQVLLKRNRMRGTFHVARTQKKKKINEKWQNARIVAIKRKITNKQTSENIYKLIPGAQEKDYNKKMFFLLLHSACRRSGCLVHCLFRLASEQQQQQQQ